MKVEKISATVRYSQDTGNGAWKVIELGAEASISDREHWKQAQSELYYQIADQLRTLWSNGSNGANSQSGAESHVGPLPEPVPVSGSGTRLEHWCEEHRAEFKRRQKAGVVWYSHRQGKGWCNEPQPEPAERR